MNPKTELLRDIFGTNCKILNLYENVFFIEFNKKPLSIRSEIKDKQLKKLYKNKIKIFLNYKDKTIIAKFS